MEYKPLQIGELTADVPIVQGGMGIGISLGGLAGAVAKAGAVGIISAAQIGYLEEGFEKHPFESNLRAIKSELLKARKIADGKGIIGFNIMVAMKNYGTYVAAAAKAGADIIISGAGLPTDLPALIEGYKTKIAPIVSTGKSANVILKYWDKKYSRTADLVVIEGPKAGGHLGFTAAQLEKYDPISYEAEIQNILEIVHQFEEKYDCQIPVVVGGGIDTPEDMEHMVELGVQGVQIATKFIPTEECDADIRYKQALINAQKEDVKIVKSPVGMPGRAIMNPFMEKVMSGVRVAPRKCLQCLHKCNPAEIPYCITEALIHTAKGNVENGLLFCGSEAYKATKISTVKEVIDYYRKI